MFCAIAVSKNATILPTLLGAKNQAMNVQQLFWVSSWEVSIKCISKIPLPGCLRIDCWGHPTPFPRSTWRCARWPRCCAPPRWRAPQTPSWKTCKQILMKAQIEKKFVEEATELKDLSHVIPSFIIFGVAIFISIVAFSFEKLPSWYMKHVQG